MGDLVLGLVLSKSLERVGDLGYKLGHLRDLVNWVVGTCNCGR